MSIKVQADSCVGAGQCALVAPNVFDQDNDGIVVVLNAEPKDSDLDAANRAARLCPARAITVTGQE